MKLKCGAQVKKAITNASFQRVSLFILLINLSSCSYFQSRGGVVSDPQAPAPQKKTIETVPKVQYEQLLSKYEQLLEEKKQKAPVANEEKKAEVLASELVETVDVFETQKGTVSPAPSAAPSTMSAQNVERQIQIYQKAKTLAEGKKYDESMIILRELEASSFGQIRVRVKYLIGELLFLQKEYDLAMQKFEEIISQNAFSGVIIKTLKKLIQCSEALNLNRKRERYYSILHDFFES